MSVIITSDLHLTDKYKDEYRWGLFPWLKEQLIKYEVKTLLFLGDTTDAKDKHSAKLTNRIVDTFKDLALYIKEFYILRGNHDYIDENTPFFKFLDHLPGIQFITSPFIIQINSDKTALLIPNTKNFFVKNGKLINLELGTKIDYIFCHQTFKGAIVENGTTMEGLSPNIFDDWDGKVISGDIHVPQTLNKGKITYVGAPYPIRFNDTFLPRVILLQDDGKIKNLFYKTIKKHTINITNPSELDNFKLRKNDQVKIRLSIDDPSNWENYKTEIITKCKDLGVDLHQVEFIRKQITLPVKEQSVFKSLTSAEIFIKFCEHAKLSEDIKNYGLSIYEGVKI